MVAVIMPKAIYSFITRLAVESVNGIEPSLGRESLFKPRLQFGRFNQNPNTLEWNALQIR
jgi:hypothetical protein